MDRLRFAIGALILLAGLAACARGGGTAPASQAPGGGPAPGVRVYIDPVTGEAREPTRAEAAASAAPARVQPAAAGGQAASEGAQQREHFVLPDGTEGVTLRPQDRRAVVVCRQADGSYSENCPPAPGGAAP